MGVAKVAVTIQESVLKRLDRLVQKSMYPSRSRIDQPDTDSGISSHFRAKRCLAAKEIMGQDRSSSHAIHGTTGKET